MLRFRDCGSPGGAPWPRSDQRPHLPDASRRRFLGTAIGLSGAASLGRLAWPGSGEAPAAKLDFASAVEAARAIRGRRISSVELTRRILERVDRYNPALNAYVNVLAESALGRAKEADAATPPQPPTDLPVAGSMARRAEDLELGLRVMGGPVGDDAIAYRWTLPPARHERLADYRIGFVLDHPLCPVSADVKAALATAVDALGGAGAKLEEGWPAGVDPRAQFETYWYLLGAFFAFNLEDEVIERERALAADPDGGLDAVWARARVEPHKHYQAASSQRMVARAVWQSYFRTHDAFLLPTTFVTAFPHDHSEPMSARRIATPEGPRRYTDNFFWISFATLTGLPATTAPVGLTRDGLPVGIQILGPYLEDATPIDVARGMAEVIGGFRPPSGYGA